MPTLKMTEEGTYYTKVYGMGRFITYQVKDAGVCLLGKRGFPVGQEFPVELLQELRNQDALFTYGTGISNECSTVTITDLRENVNIQKVYTNQTLNAVDMVDKPSAYKDGNEHIHLVFTDFSDQFDYPIKLNRHGSFFKKQQKYVQMSEDEPMVPGMMHCIVFYGTEGHKIVPFPNIIKTRCIGRHNIWVAWEFRIPQQPDISAYKWCINIKHPMR